MIELDGDITIDMTALSHSKDLKDLWENETDAFVYGLYSSRVNNYIKNVNLRKKNYTLYSEYTSIMRETQKYKEDMQKLMDEYVVDGEESPIGLVNYVLKNIKCEPEDLNKIAFALGRYVQYNLKSS